jgi:hypothetical protein
MYTVLYSNVKAYRFLCSLLVLSPRDSVTRFFASGFLHGSVSPQPQSIPLELFRIFFEILASQGAPPVSTTPVANNGNNIRLLRPYSELEGKNVFIS